MFANTTATHILGITDARNTPSIRLLERLGFKGLETRQVTFREEPCSEKVYDLAK